MKFIRSLIPQPLKNFIRSHTSLGRVSQLLSKYLPSIICIDVGASYYPHTKWLLFLNSPKTNWLAVDPNEANLSYVKNWSWDSDISIATTGLSREGGPKTLYITNVDSGSSLLEPQITDSMKHRVKNLDYFFPFRTREIETLSLVQVIYGMPVDAPIFIKLDTQGTELSILMGASDLFEAHRIVGVEMESTMLAQPIMKGSGKFWEACEFLEGNDFELLHIKPIHAPKNSRKFISNRSFTFLNECDAVFALRYDVASKLSVEYRASLLAFYLTNLFYQEALSALDQDKNLVEFLLSQGCNVKHLIDKISSSI